MKSRFKLGQFAGIGVYAHWSLVVAFAGVFLWMLWQSRSVTMAIDALVLTIALFSCVVLHEFGHALTARRFGIPTLHITMYPIGGIALLARMPHAPRQELLIAIAGPAVNLAIAALLFVLVLLRGHTLAFGLIVIDAAGEVAMLSTLMSLNMLLFAFNLVPAFPMDGGRVLRAALATRWSYANATRVASYVGQAIAVLFAVAAVFPNPVMPGFNPVLLFVALFIFSAAREEAAFVLRAQQPSV